MIIQNIYNVDRNGYSKLTKEQKMILYPNIIPCTSCGNDLCTVEEYNKFINGKYIGKRNLFLPVFFENNLFYREICICCSDNKYPNKKYNLTTSEQSKYILQMPDEIHNRLKKSRAVTQENFINKYGEELGIQKFEEYKQKQAYSNSQEYKGMTDDEFKEYNKSRAVTIETMIKKYGNEIGMQKYNDYCAKQSYTNSLEYFIEKYGDEGKEKYAKCNFLKSHSLASYVHKYGEEDGRNKFEYYMQNSTNGYQSKIASDFFKNIDDELNIEHNIYYAPKTKEFGKINEELQQYTFFDFVIPELKLCIEFNGDCFHANPKKYIETDCPNPYNKLLTAKEIWEFDNIKNNVLIKLGFDVLIIWESDYNENKNKIINDIISFIKERNEEYNNRRKL